MNVFVPSSLFLYFVQNGKSVTLQDLNDDVFVFFQPLKNCSKLENVLCTACVPATSSGEKEGMHNVHLGACYHQNMKLTIKVMRQAEGTTSSKSPSLSHSET